MSAATPEAGATEISVVVVNYGTAELSIAGVNSVLERNHGGRSVDIHVVDNNAPGDDAAKLRNAFGGPEFAGRVTLYLETENHGFGRGNNVALRALAARPHPPKYAMLLNPDAALENEALDILADCLDTRPKVAAAGAGMTAPDGTPLVAAFRFPGALSELSRGFSMWPIRDLLKQWRTILPPDHPGGAVDWVVGAAVMIRMDVLREIDFFDPAFFLYYEEVDLMRRIRAAGHAVHYVPQARVIHDEGAATKVSWKETKRKRKPDYLYDSWRIYFSKAYGRFGALGISLLLIVGSAANLGIKTLTGRMSTTPLGFFRSQTVRVVLPLLSGRAPRS